MFSGWTSICWRSPSLIFRGLRPVGQHHLGQACVRLATFYSHANQHGHGWALNNNHHPSLTTRALRPYAQQAHALQPAMSSSEEENFNLDVSGSDSESDDYAPAPKKTTKASAVAVSSLLARAASSVAATAAAPQIENPDAISNR